MGAHMQADTGGSCSSSRSPSTAWRPATLSFEVSPGGVRARVGPLRDTALADALQGPEPPPGELTLPRILSTVVDSYGVEEVSDDHLVVRLEKLVRNQ